jgi:hypothetical protein
LYIKGLIQPNIARTPRPLAFARNDTGHSLPFGASQQTCCAARTSGL